MGLGNLVATFDEAFRETVYNTTVIDRDGNQYEFTKSLWNHLATVVYYVRVRNGRCTSDNNVQPLEPIEETFGVDKEIVVAI